MIFSLKKSLLAKLVTTVSLLSLTTVTIGAITVYFSTRNTLSQSVFTQLHLRANFKENEINQWFQIQQQNLQELETNLIDLLNEENTVPQSLKNYHQINQYLQSLGENQPYPRKISLLEPNGTVLVSTDKNLEGKTNPFGTIFTTLNQKPTETKFSTNISQVHSQNLCQRL